MGRLTEFIKEDVEKKKTTAVQWYEKNIKLIPQYSLATHVGKYTDPSAKAFLLELRSSGNREYVTTASSSAVLTDIVYPSANSLGAMSFLLCELEDGRPLFEHVMKEDPAVFQELRELGLDPQGLVDGVRSMGNVKMPDATEYRLRQVYFPAGDGTYRLLTPLPQSSLLASLNRRYWAMYEKREKRKICRTADEFYYEEKYTKLLNCVVMEFGGANPRNISMLNYNRQDLNGPNRNDKGKSLLLSSLPPCLEDREVHFPRRDFFSETLPYFSFRDPFMKLHRLFKDDRNNVEIRRQIRELTGDVADEVLLYCCKLRAEGEGWSDRESCSKLPKSQKIWLDDKYAEARKDGQWIQEVADAFGRWFIKKYRWVADAAKEGPVVLGDAEMTFFAETLEAALREEVRFRP